MESASGSSSFDRSMLLSVRFVGYLIHWYLVVVQLILGLGFILLAFGANQSSGFVSWAYRSLDRAMGPFRGIFEPLDLGSSGGVDAVFDTSILFAMVAYGILLSAVNGGIGWATRKIHAYDVEQRVREQQAAYRASAPSADTAPPDIVGSMQAPEQPASTSTTDQTALRTAPQPAMQTQPTNPGEPR